MRTYCAAKPANGSPATPPAESSAVSSKLLDLMCRMLLGVSSAVVAFGGTREEGDAESRDASARSEAISSGQWVLFEKMAWDASSLIAELIVCQDEAVHRLASWSAVGKHADKSSSDGAGGAAVKAEIAMWGAAVERMKVILLVLAISARMDGPVPSVDEAARADEEQDISAQDNADISWWLLAQLVPGGASEGPGQGAIALTSRHAASRRGMMDGSGYARGLRPPAASLSLLTAPSMGFLSGGAGPGMGVGGGGSGGLEGEPYNVNVRLGEMNRNLYLVSGGRGERKRGPSGVVGGALPAQGAQSSSLMQKIQRERQAAMASLQGGQARVNTSGEGVILPIDDDLLSYLGVGRGQGFERFDLRTLHLLDVLGAYFPYCRSAVTEAIVSYLTAQHSAPSIAQYAEVRASERASERETHANESERASEKYLRVRWPQGVRGVE